MARDKKESETERRERLLDEALGETFPASDPISPAIPPGEPGGDANKRVPRKH